MRDLPNIIVTGTPGTGKSKHCEKLGQILPELTVVSINKFIQDHDLESSFDKARNSVVADEDKLLDLIQPELEAGGKIIDWHVCDIFQPELIDLVIVLRADTTHLYDRLKARGYANQKFEENIDAEIMGEILNDAQESYEPEIIVELHSDNDHDLETNCQRIKSWFKQWVIDNTKQN
ncbi:AAA domain-containing protein [Lipomyces oligophaga]|uniref:AAA domain-containing protein n=1 Tax=Lipomyces oligophaga TaxID=45792 RepID=UPI0034CE37B9